MVEQTDVQAPQASVQASDNVTLLVLDSCLYPTPFKRVPITLPKTSVGGDVVNKIAELGGYPKDAVELKWQQNQIDCDEQRTLEELGLLAVKGYISAMKKAGKDIVLNKPPNMLSVHESSTSSMSAGSSSSSSSTQLITYGPSTSSHTSYSPYSSSTGYTSSYPYSWSSQSQGKSASGYIGLSNQGATCYMNSLIQTLFMTPEFRNGLYNWSFEEKIRNDRNKAAQKGEENGNGKGKAEDAAHAGANGANGKENGAKDKENGTKSEENGNGSSNPDPLTGLTSEEREKKEKSSIPLQLQRLFARLQLCDVQAVKTKDLTKSFGWEDADAFTQHDVQELCRVLFDALEKNFQGTKQANLVNDLYQGKMKDYVQCKECKHESARVDHYLDIPLVIRGFGETIPVKSVEEALHKFVQPEVLDKENQYSCEKCNKKVDANKGLKIEKFPYLLTLQLKRFDFDFQTMRRVKLNDRVTFPLYLDLNPLIHGKRAPVQQKPPQDEEEEEEEDEEMERDEKGKGRAEHQEFDPRSHQRTADSEEISSDSQHQGQGESFDAEPDFDAPPPLVTPELPYVYELFSVMIHRGSSMGGHYYAYVKSFETNKWYEFNDSIVSEISVNEVKKAFGGDEDGGYTSLPRNVYNSYRSNANAYMLMYRQIETDRNKKPMSSTEIPEELKKVVETENGAAKQKKKAEELEREMVKMKIYYNGEDKQLNMHKTATLDETATAALKLYNLEKVASGNYRLRNYSHTNELPGDTYTGKETKTLEQLNFFIGHYTAKSLLLEIKESNEEFEDFNPSMMLFRVAKYNPTTQGFDPVVNVYVDRNGTVGDLREAIEQKVGIPKDKMNMYKEPSYPTWNSPPATIIEKPNDTDLRYAHFVEPEKFYVEYSNNPVGMEEEEDDERESKEKDDRDEKEESPVILALERIKNIIEVKFNLPGKEEYDQKISVDKNMLVKDFKEKIQHIVGLPLDDFKIKRGSPPHLYELVGDSDSLSDVSVRDGMSLTIEKGKPLKEGEAHYTFELFDLSKDTDNFTDLFEIPVHEDMLISDVKQLILPLLQQKNLNVSDPAHIRLRDVSSSQYSRRIGKVFQDSLTVKKATMYVYSKRMAVQVLEEPESLTNQEKEICFFVQQFKPSSFELTRKEDFVINEEATLDELRERLGTKYGIDPKNVGIVRVDNYYNYYDDPDLLEVPEMSWDRPTISYSIKNTVGDTMMMRNGYLMLFRDNTDKLKELTKDEKEAIKKETNKRKTAQNQNNTSYSFWNRKERALKIQSEG